MARGREGKLFGKNRTSVVGDKEVRRALKSLGAKVRREIMVPAMEAAMDPMFARAKQEIDVASGETLGHLVEKTKGQTKGRILVDVAITKVWYAGFHEYGTRYRPGDHDMLRAFDMTKTAAVATALQKVRDGIERKARS